MISLIIPVTKHSKYSKNIVNNINSLYPNNKEIQIILEVNDSVSLGINYNNAIAKADGDKVILLHDDMIIGPGFIEAMDNLIKKGTIVTYTRVEPPIYNDEYPGKIIHDCGYDIETFNEQKFIDFKTTGTISGGSQLFFGCMKEDYIGIDGYTFKKFCEDDDLHRRYELLGFKKIVSLDARVYHFVSKTSRNGNYGIVDLEEIKSNRNYIRKWGSRGNAPKYNIAIILTNGNIHALETLEPWCDRIYVQNKFDYIEKEQPNTKFDLSKRVMTIGLNDPQSENDIVIEIDANKFNQRSFELLQQLPLIIKESGDIGTFELEDLKITINQMEEKQNDLIKLV
jgi:hypothetical protein